MKTRSDFVSNSSSSSYIISTKRDVVGMEQLVMKKFTPPAANRFSADLISKIVTTNRDTVSVGLRNNIVLFLGEYIDKIDGKDVYAEHPIVSKKCDVSEFLRHKEWYYVPKDYDFNNETIESAQRLQKCTPEQAKESFIEEIKDVIKNYNTVKYQSYTIIADNDCAEITKETLEITQYMIDYGMPIKVDSKLFNNVKSELDTGKRVYIIDCNDEGLGIDYGSIFVSRCLDYDVEDGSKNISKIDDIKVLSVIN